MDLNFTFVIFLWINFLVTEAGIYDDDDSDYEEDEGNFRIVGGSAAHQGQFPFMASIQVYQGKGRRWLRFCGGSIIGERHILTAAHCIKSLRYRVVLGSNTPDKDGEIYDVEKIITHPNWHESKTSVGHPFIINDIAVIVLSKNIKFSKSVRKIELSHRDVPSGSYALIIGWGLISSHPRIRLSELQYTMVKTLSAGQCKFYWPIRSSAHQMCTSRPRKGTCFGDSGGPVVVDDVQVGIVSFGPTICAGPKPDVQVKVWRHMGFINECLGYGGFGF